MAYTGITALWTGFPGAPGYSRFRFQGALTGPEASDQAFGVRAFLDVVGNYLPSNVTLTIQGQAETFDDTGRLTGAVVIDPVPQPVVGIDPGAYAAPVGAVVVWLTAGITNGRRVRGRTFLVPLAASAFAADGTLINATRSALATAAQNLAAETPPLVIGSRQDPGVSGTTVVVTGATVPDKSAVLRSRRD